MATATAHFDLTKAGSNENYNVGLVNSNLDKIDQQMYLNQTSAAKVMVGASANEDGESGRVPAPSAGDEDKYLKADGTWDTPSGGGGGSSTLVGLTDVDISSPTNGQVLKYNSVTQKWENADESGSSQRTYLGQLIPRVSASDSKITASTSNSSYSAWGAFNGTSPSNLSSPDTNSCWLPEANLTDQWIKYHFDAQRYFTKIGIVCFSNYSSNWVGDIKVEGSTDGSTWENILASGTTYELTAELQNSTTVEINLDDTDLWEYIRVTFVDEMSVAYQPSCFVDEIYVYGGGLRTNSITPTLSSGTKIADYEIDGVSGELYAPTPGTPTRRYLGTLIPRVSSADSHITASSEGSYGSTVWYAWGAFSDTQISNWSVPESGATWVDNSESNPWIQYHFDSARYFTQITVACGSNYSGAYTGTIYIEASNDGTNWTDIGNGAQTINAPLRTIQTNTYSLDDTDTWTYIRIRGAQSFFIVNNPGCFIQSINAYGGDIIQGIDASTIDFSTLTSAQITQLQTLLGIGGE